jgi:hypothetical protein
VGGNFNSNGQFDLQGSTELHVGPIQLASINFDVGNENPFHVAGIPAGAMELTLSGGWDFGPFSSANLTATIYGSNGNYDVSAHAKGTLLGNTIQLDGDISPGKYDLHASNTVTFYGATLSSVSIDLKSSAGFSVTATWDVPLVFDGQVTGTIGLDGHVQLSAQAQVLHIGGFGLSMSTTIDLNPAIGACSIHVGATQDILVATVGFSADASWQPGQSPQLAIKGHAALTGILADIIEGSVDFDLEPNRVHFHGDVHIPKVPQASFSIDATVDASGALTGIPGINGLGSIARDLQKLGAQAAALWHQFIGDAGQVAQGLENAIGLGGKDLVNALSTVVPDPGQLSNALQKGLNWNPQQISGQLGSIGGSVKSTVTNVVTNVKHWKIHRGLTEGGIVFIDTNFNNILDSGEPQGFTDNQGGLNVYIPANLDPNNTGVLADSVAQLVEQDGTDLVTGLPEVGEGIAPGSWSVISSLTTLVSLLYDNYGFTVSQGESQVLLAIGLPAQVDLSTYDSTGAILAGDPNGPTVFGTESILENTIAMVTALVGGTPDSAQANAVQGAFAGLIAHAAAPLDFGNASTIKALIQAVGTSTGQTLDPNVVAGASTVIAGANQEIESIPQTTDLAYIRKVAQVSIVAQGRVSSDLASAAAGQMTIDTVLANDTGAALGAAIAATPTPPTVVTPMNVTVAATSAAGAALDFTTQAYDIAGEALRPTTSIASGSVFPIGVTTVTTTATDSLGDTLSTTFTVTVLDSAPPTITLPANLVVEANTTGGANVTLPQATANDPVDPAPVVSEDQSSGFFPIGTTTVNVTATDSAGNVSIGAFTVTVVDTTPPTLTPPANLMVEANTTGGANVVLPRATAADIADPNPTVSEDQSSGFFPLGTTTVNVTATDASGNTTTGTFTVTVTDTTAPALSVPSNLVVEANTTGGAFVTLPAATASDVADPNPTITEDHSSGFFPLGSTTVDVTATDASGNTSTGAFTVTVVNTTAPTLTLPINLVIQANRAGGAIVTLPSATASDVADPNPMVSEDQTSGFFPLGTTAVNVTATDASGNTSTGTFTVTVVNTTPPTLTLPNNIVVQANTTGGAFVTLPTATASDVADPNPLISYDHFSGFYPLGTTTVNVTANDSSGNTTTGSFTVTVVNNTPPTLTLPSGLVVEANVAGGGAQVTLPVATATDVADLNPVITYDHSSGFFPMGVTTVNVTASDASGNTSTGSFTVTVVDTTPPTITLPANVVVPAGSATGATVTLPQATATDLVDPNPVVAYDHSSGFFPVGTTLVTVSATDASGNTNLGSFTVTVNPVTTTTTLVNNSPAVSTYGDQLSFSVSVSSGVGAAIPDGETVELEDASNGNAFVATGTLENGSATIVVSGLNAGSHNLFAYYDGDNSNAAAPSTIVTQVVNKRQLFLKAVTNTKGYDGTTSAQAMPVVVGLQGSDTVTGLSESYADPTLGSGQSLIPSGSVNDGNGGNNYSVTFVNNITGVITKGTPVLTWANPADITTRTVLGASQLDATANLPGTFSYTPAAGATLPVGHGETLAVTFTPADTAHYTTATATVTINVNPATPVVTWANPADITYGTPLGAGQLNATSNVAGTLVYSVPGGTVLHAGNAQTLQVTFTPNDTIDYTTVTQQVTISVNPAALTITADAQTKVYGSTDPALTYQASGFQLSDTAVTVLSGALTRAPGESVAGGPYTISQGTLATDSNYTISFTGSSLSITPATLTVTANAQTKVYGQADPALTYVASGFQFADTAPAVLTGGLGRVTGENVGSCDIGQGTLAANSNYSIQFTGSTLSITPASLTVTADDQSKVYGAPDPALNYTVSGTFYFGDDPSVVSGVTLATVTGPAATAGTHTITATGGRAANYTITDANGTLTVSKAAALTVTADNQGKVYGAADPTLTYTPSGTLYYGDTYAVISGVTLSTDTGAAATAGTHTITASGGTAANYDVAFVNGTLNVSKAAALTVTADNQSKVYGAADPTLTYTPSGALYYGDTYAVISGVTLSTDTGAAATAGAHTIMASGGTTANYDVAFVNGTLTVSKAAALTVTGDSQSKVYGAADPALTDTPSGTLYYGDTYAVISGVTLSTDTGAAATAGMHTITAAGGTAANYNVTLVNGTLTVSRAALSVTGNNQRKVYGQVDPALTYVSSGYQYTDTAATVLTGGLTRTAGETVAGGPYAISQGTLAANSNYTIQFTGGTLSITPAPLTITADTKTKVYGAPLPTLTASYSGLVNGDTPAVFNVSPNVAPALSATATAASDVAAGGYPIAVSSALDPDYAITFVSGVLTIVKANETITWNAPALINYGTPLGATQLDAAVSVVGPALAGALTYTPAAGTVLGPGLQTLSVTGAATNDYNAASATVTINVLYHFSGFLAPLHANMTYALGRTIPIKFQLTNASGNFISSLSAITSLQIATVNANGSLGTPFNPTAAGGTSLTYDTTAKQYVFNWQTKGLAAGNYEILLSLNDGSIQSLALTLSSSGAFQLTDGTTSAYVSSTANQVLYGTLTVAVQDDTGNGLDASEVQRIGDAMTYLNEALGSFGVYLSWAAPGMDADVHVHFASSTPEGGAGDGVLGFTTADNDVYFVTGWSFYTGADPSQIGAGQYDFLTLATHELAHTVGLGESNDPGSVMYEYLTPGTVRRSFTDSNLALINTDADRFMKVALPATAGLSAVPGSANATLLEAAFSAQPPAMFPGAFPSPLVLGQGNENAFIGMTFAGPVDPHLDGHAATTPALDGDDSVLVGGAGNDLVIGGAGRNLLTGGFGFDQVTENGGAKSPKAPRALVESVALDQFLSSPGLDLAEMLVAEDIR